jgi:transposase
MKKYKVTLTAEERRQLKEIIDKQRVVARKRKHAYILFKADESEGGPHWTDERIRDAYDVSLRTAERVRERFVEHGLEAALQARAPQENRKRKFDGKKEAQLISLACGKAPEGYARWTLTLLADKMVELKYMESISSEAIRKVLKKTNLSLG